MNRSNVIDSREVVGWSHNQGADLDKGFSHATVTDDVDLMVAMLRASLQTPDRRQAPRT